MIVLLTRGVFADGNESSIPVNVSILAVTEITINPTYLIWTDIPPGTEGGVVGIDVINIGSTNVTGFYSYVDTLTDETANPIGSSDPQSYTASGVLTLSTNDTISGTTGDHYFAGRLEWNHTDRIELISLPAFAVSWGWFRNASREYVWTMVNGSDGTCNASDSEVRVNNWDDVGNSTTRDLATLPANYDADNTLDSQVEDWGIFSFSGANSPWNNYCVAAYYDCTKLYVYKYDRRNTGNTNFVGCDNIDFLNTTMWRGPGQIQKMNLDVWIPYGVPAGNFQQGTLTIYAETGS
jgi:hypothetical protein